MKQPRKSRASGERHTLTITVDADVYAFIERMAASRFFDDPDGVIEEAVRMYQDGLEELLGLMGDAVRPGESGSH